MGTIIEKLNSAIKNWWISLIVGILFIGFAIFLLMYPLATYVTLSILFSAFMLVSGLFEIIFAVSNRQCLNSWGWYLAGGVIDLIIGIMLVFIPGLSMEVLPFILAFWMMFRGFSGVGFALDARRYGSYSWGWNLALAIITILLSIGIIWLPAVGALTFVIMTAYAFIVMGVFRLVLAFELRSLYRKNKKFHT